MRICTIGRTELRLHPLLFAVLAAAGVLGKLMALLQALFAICVHELSHAVVSYGLGVRVRSLELLPFGAVARLDRQGMAESAELAIAAAGPLASLLVAGVTAVMAGLFSGVAVQTEAFLTYNIVLAAVNLLPALPLDGGRILRAVLQRRCSFRTASLIPSVLGILFGAGFLVLTVMCAKQGVRNLTFPTMGVFLLLAAIAELRGMPEAEVHAYYRRMDALRDGRACRVECYAVPATMRAGEAARLLSRDRFHVLRVVDAELRCIGELDERSLLAGIAAYGAQPTLKDLLVFDHCKGV